MRRDQIALALHLFAFGDRLVTLALAAEVLRLFERAAPPGVVWGAGGLSQAERDALVATAAGWPAERIAALLHCPVPAVRVTLVSSIEKLARSIGADDDPFGSGDRAPGPRPHDPPALKATRPLPADDEEQSEPVTPAAFTESAGQRGFEAL